MTQVAETAVEAGVLAAAPQQCLVVALLDDPPAFQDDDPVGPLDGGEAMGDDDPDDAGCAGALLGLERVAHLRGEYTRATALLEEGLALCRAAGDDEGCIWLLSTLGYVALAHGEDAPGRGCLPASPPAT